MLSVHVTAPSQSCESWRSCCSAACCQASRSFVQGTFRMHPHASPVVTCVRRHLFPSMIVEKLTQDSPWLSVATRHPWDPFTRAQRLTCSMTLLLCNMVTSLMFWRMSGPAAHRDGPGPAEPCGYCSRRVTLSSASLSYSPYSYSLLTCLRFFPLLPNARAR